MYRHNQTDRQRQMCIITCPENIAKSTFPLVTTLCWNVNWQRLGIQAVLPISGPRSQIDRQIDRKIDRQIDRQINMDNRGSRQINAEARERKKFTKWKCKTFTLGKNKHIQLFRNRFWIAFTYSLDFLGSKKCHLQRVFFKQFYHSNDFPKTDVGLKCSELVINVQSGFGFVKNGLLDKLQINHSIFNEQRFRTLKEQKVNFAGSSNYPSFVFI